MRRYRVLRAAGVTRDLDLIEDHLTQTYQDFGDSPDEAMRRAEARIDAVLIYLRTFTTHPHRGTEHPTIRPGIRAITNQNVITYFEIDDAQSEVKILAIFFGGADHRRQIMDRLQT